VTTVVNRSMLGSTAAADRVEPWSSRPHFQSACRHLEIHWRGGVVHHASDQSSNLSFEIIRRSGGAPSVPILAAASAGARPQNPQFHSKRQ
jgi:hypothetical protein